MLMNMATTQKSSLLRTHRLQREITSAGSFELMTMLFELLTKSTSLRVAKVAGDSKRTLHRSRFCLRL